MQGFGWAVPSETMPEPRPLRWRNVLLMLLGVGVLFVVMPSLVVSAAFFVFFMPLVALIFNGFWLGLAWVTSVSVGLARLRESKSWDLLISTPLGAWESAWAVAVMCLARGRMTAFGRVMSRLLRGVSIAVLLMLMFFAPALFERGIGALAIFSTLISYAGVVAVLWLDHVQTQLMAGLWGILATCLARTATEARLLGVSVFIMARLSLYLLLFMLQNALYALLMIGTWRENALLLATLGGVLLYYTVHEVLIRALWWGARAWYGRVYP